jgi:hypothetical protein
MELRAEEEGHLRQTRANRLREQLDGYKGGSPLDNSPVSAGVRRLV